MRWLLAAVAAGVFLTPAAAVAHDNSNDHGGCAVFFDTFNNDWWFTGGSGNNWCWGHGTGSAYPKDGFDMQGGADIVDALSGADYADLGPGHDFAMMGDGNDDAFGEDGNDDLKMGDGRDSANDNASGDTDRVCTGDAGDSDNVDVKDGDGSDTIYYQGSQSGSLGTISKDSGDRLVQVTACPFN